MMNTEKKMNLEEISFQIILHAGNAKSCAMEGLQLARAGDFTEAFKKIDEADQEFVNAHHFQTNLLQKESSGESVNPSILLIHAQDHLMTAMTTKEMANEIIHLHQLCQTK